jgi:hypothetical protein
VRHSAGPTKGDVISFGDDVLDINLDLSVGGVKGAVDGFRAWRADEDGVGLGEAVETFPSRWKSSSMVDSLL